MHDAPPPLRTDGAALVAQIRAGDRHAFERLFREMYAPVVAFAARYVGDPRAEELAQELFFDLWQKREQWELRGSVRAYLFTAARNRALNVRRRDAVEHDWADEEGADSVRHLHAPPPRPDELLDTTERTATVASALAALPERARLAMHLRWRDELSYAEIADVLGITVKSVENSLARSLKALRARVESLG
ncbi:MAG: RNA polymerase sigma-70 factor [Gemmatimonadaceae bacterium]|jgi:RNA polymerase sigma-70 factor (ECF subfamily)|nr:RNA polymerase sigma-70 factor [Gemmatimonadaceae bacterium]